MTKRIAAALASLALTMALTGCQQAAKPVEQAAAVETRPPDPVRIVDRSTYFEEDLNADVSWRQLSNGVLEYKMALPLLREGENPGQWFTKDEFRLRRRLAAESRERGDRPVELTEAQKEAKRRARRHGMVR